MESSWQNKCGSTWQSSVPCLASSSSNEFRLETEMNTGHCFHSNDPKEARAKLLGTVQHSLFFSNSNLTSNRMDRVNHGSSFLGLLSEPPSVMQCDFQELSNPKPNCTIGLLTSDISSAVVDAAESAIPLTFGWQPSENLSDVKVQNHHLGADTFSYISSRAMSSSNACSGSVLPDLHSSELGKMVIHHLVSGTDKVKDSLSLGSDWHVTGNEIAGKLHGRKFQTTQTGSAQPNSFTNLSSDILNCPRVFCLSKEGYLLISNTGLLGIVCFCHFIHMSVSKFCEHAGLCGVNPGDVVRMDSGETIAQWCRIYVQKFGIRVSEDLSVWDWPKELSVHAGLKKFGVTKPNVSCNFSHMVRSSESLSRSGQLLENVVSKNHHADQNLVNGAFQNKQKRNIQDHNNEVLQGLIGTSRSSMHAMADKQMLNFPESQCPVVSKFIGSGPQNWSTSNSVHIDSVLNLLNSSVVQPAFQKPSNYCKEQNFRMDSNADDSLLHSRDVVSSNIELKLGQPYQSSQHSGNSEILGMRQQPMRSLGDLRMSIFPEKTVHNVGCREKVERGQSLCFASSSCSMVSKGEYDQTNIRNKAFGIQGVNSSAGLLNYRGKLGQNSVNSSWINYNNLIENCMERRAIGNTLNNMEISMPNLQHSVPHFAAYDIDSAPKDGDNVLEQPSNRFECGSSVLDDKGKGVGSVTNQCCFLKDSGFRACEDLELDSSLHILEAHRENFQSRQLSNIPLDTFDAGRYLSFGNNVQATCFNHKSLASPIGSDSTMILPSNRVLNESTCLLDQTPTLFRENGVGVGSCLLNDNFRLLAKRQIQELSTLQQSVCSIPNEEEVQSRGVSYLQHSFGVTSTPNEHLSMHDFTRRGVSETTEKTSQCGARCRFGCNKGISSCCSDFSTLTKGIAGQSLFSNNTSQNEQSGMRCDKNNAGHGKHENCRSGKPCSSFKWNGNSAVHINSLGRCSEPIIGSLPTSFNEKTGVPSGEVSMKSKPTFAENHSVGHLKIISSDQGGKLNRPITQSVFAQASQWKDVPSKSRGIINVKHVDSSACIVDVKGYDGSQNGDNSSKCFSETVQTTNSSKETMQTLNSFKEHDVSHFASGCSAPAVTHVSPAINDMDSSSAHAGNSGCVSNVVDEESRIDENWSSDDAHGSGRSSDFSGATCKTSFKKSQSSKNTDHQSPRSLLEELKLINSLTWKKCTEVQPCLAVQSKDAFSQKLGRKLKTGKRKRYRSSLLCHGNPKNITSAELSSCSWNSVPVFSPSSQGKTQGASFSEHISKQKLSILSSAKKLRRKRDIDELYEDSERKDVCLTKLNASLGVCGIPDVSSGTKSEGDYTSQFRKNMLPEPLHEGSLKNKCISIACDRKSRPIVYGKYGELSDGKLVDDMLKPAKIVSLSRVLKYAKRCALPIVIPGLRVKDLRKMSHEGYCGESYIFKTEKGSKNCNVTFCSKVNDVRLLEKTSKGHSNRENGFAEESSLIEEVKHNKSDKDDGKVGSISQWKPKCKKVQKRCIYELTVTGGDPHSKRFFPSKSSKCSPEVKEGKPLWNDEDKKHVPNIIAEKLSKEKMSSSILDSDGFCCVCSSSNKDEMNFLLQCSLCLIKVHQACYGVPRVPKGQWYCRPCRSNLKDTVCVLCGYGGGAMTRALRSHIIVKSLMRNWNIEIKSKLKSKVSFMDMQQSELVGTYSRPSELRDTSFSVFRTANHGTLDSAVHNMDMSYQHDVLEKPPYINKLKVQNSIMAGLLDPTTKQWVHMVCALWTPGTRCPNVDTMSAFDVSGASRPRESVICSICGRSGGSCIRCRVVNCSIQFHPWCAHQKDLLQIEGVENEKVAFYGRCAHHAAQLMCESGWNHSVAKTGLVVEEFTCARTEDFNGRKHDGFLYNQLGQSKGKGGCLVPQDQLNAWMHINGQKSRGQGLGIKPISDTEYDCRKEYVRYKQAKGWKHLIVYKSHIHALGLYTSRFISPGEMVVEYVGEIVGQRVADKREHEYQSGRRLQYKSACYFFRIDKEHIIDATRKGGIARFVNHSCLPNCVAKVISVRNEKKVVFFAVREIFPGEEITYNYHFNHEDEGKKIPCFCNSNNCRRYMN